jgi:hypothetical protein
VACAAGWWRACQEGSDLNPGATPQLFFTAPPQAHGARRGDALGLRALVDRLADAVAPGLSNRTQDIRWMAILSWCLVNSDAACSAASARKGVQQVGHRQRYAWIRPLELMWVARTIALDGERSNRSLPGRRRVIDWLPGNRRADNFGMSVAQLDRYRQTGPYGAYRSAFRKWPGMTVSGDGWTPGPVAYKLAAMIDKQLGAERQLVWKDPSEAGRSARSVTAATGRESAWWLRRWPAFLTGSGARDFQHLPSLKDDDTPPSFHAILKPVIFGADADGRRRTKVAKLMQGARGSNHFDCCVAIAKALPEVPDAQLIPPLLALTDAALEVMDWLRKELAVSPCIPIERLKSTGKGRDLLRALHKAAKAWLRQPERSGAHVNRADALAQALCSKNGATVLEALINHHLTFGSGLRWLTVRNGQVETSALERVGSSRYGFRLGTLGRLAAQCDVIKGRPAFALASDPDAEDEDE